MGARFFASVQTGPGTYPASCTMGTGSFPGVKRPGRGADHPPPSKCRGQERVGLYLYPPPSGPSWPVMGATLPFTSPIRADRPKNLYTPSERLTVSCRGTCSWSERANLYSRQIMMLSGNYKNMCVQVLRSPKEAFAAAMQSWRERCEKCVCLQGDYVEKILHFQPPVVSSVFK